MSNRIPGSMMKSGSMMKRGAPVQQQQQQQHPGLSMIRQTLAEIRTLALDFQGLGVANSAQQRLSHALNILLSYLSPPSESSGKSAVTNIQDSPEGSIRQVRCASESLKDG